MSVKSELVILSLTISLILCYGIAYVSYGQESDTTERDPTQIISEIRSLLNQTLSEYQNQNYTGASNLADEAYLENYELIEVPLKKQNDTLMGEIEVMLREELRDLVKTRDPITNIQQLVGMINSNLNKADILLAKRSSN